MRSQPSHRAEMVNQLLEGDTFQLLEQQEEWSRVRCDFDGYEGWVDNRQWQPYDGEANLSVGTGCSPAAMAASRYLCSPYLWGGRTSLGIDCSGLTQVCFRACGIRLLRDARQQAEQGRAVASLDEARRDDLCFFAGQQGGIVHVGIYLGEGRIIHSSGQVRIDPLTPQGILHNTTHVLTHRLHSIRRVER